MRKICFFILLIALLCLCACHTVQSEITEPKSTTAPAITDPSSPNAPLHPAVKVVSPEHILFEETMPEWNYSEAESTVMESDAINPYFQASYIHLFTSAATARYPFDGNAFWICDDPREMNQGNHYTNYIPDKGQLKQLQKNHFSESYTLFGTTVQLELEYSLLGDRVLINYEPAMGELPYAAVCDTGRGIHECLARFQLLSGSGQYVCYYAKIDLETGVLTDFLQGFDQALFSFDTKVLFWCDNDNLIAADLYDPSKIYRYNVTGKTLEECTPESDQNQVTLSGWQETPDGLLCLYEYAGEKATEPRLWIIRSTDGIMLPVSNGLQGGQLISYGRGYILYQDSKKNYCVYNTVSNEYNFLPDMKTVQQCLTSSFIYRNEQNACYIYDALNSEAILLDIPEYTTLKCKYADSGDGRKIASFYLDENNIYQLLVFDADTNTLIEIERTSGAGIREKNLQWSESDSKIIVTLEGTNDLRDFTIYDFD